MNNRYDLCIIGASLAGASLAVQLGRTGRSVLLLDKEIFPRRKSCGDGMSMLGVKTLFELGLESVLKAVPNLSLKNHQIIFPDGTLAVTPVSGRAVSDGTSSNGAVFEEAVAVGVHRSELDNELLKVALEQPSVSFLPGTMAHRIHYRGESVQIETNAGTFVSSFVALCSGAGASKFLDDTFAFDSVHQRMGVSALVKAENGALPRSICILKNDDHEWYLTPHSRERANLALLCEPHRIKDCLAASQVSLATERFADFFSVKLGQLEEFRGSLPLGGRVATPIHERLLLCGDAAETFDPIAGMGMTHALKCSLFAATALNASLEHPGAFLKMFKRYAAEQGAFAKLCRGYSSAVKYNLRGNSPSKLLRLSLTPRLYKQTAQALNGRRTPLGSPILATADYLHRRFAETPRTLFDRV